MPQHIRNIVIAAFIAVIALLAGIKGYVHHQYKTSIDNKLKQLQVFALVRYSELSTSLLSGEVKLDNVRVSSTYLPDEINLGTITFEMPGVGYMISGPEKFNKGEFPESLGLSITNSSLDLNSKLAKWVDKIIAQLQTVYAPYRKICGGKSIFGPAEYKEMGYSQLLTNMRIAYAFNEDKKTLDISLNVNTHDFIDIKTSVNISGLSSMSTAGMIQSGIPQLTNIKISYQDKTYIPHMLRYCAELSNMKKEEFINAEVSQADDYFYLSWGFAPGQGLREAYRDFLLKPNTLTLTMRPNKTFNPIAAQLMSKSELIEALNVQLQVNDLFVDDLSFTTPNPEFMARHARRLQNSLDFNAILRGEPVKPVKKPKAPVQKAKSKYHIITLSRASRHLNDYIRITTKKGNIRKGQLIKINKTTLYLQRKLYSGKFTVQVPRDKVKKIEAYFSR